MSTANEERTGQRDVLSVVLDSLDLRCRLVRETIIGTRQTTGARDMGPVFYAVLDGTAIKRWAGHAPSQRRGRSSI